MLYTFSCMTYLTTELRIIINSVETESRESYQSPMRGISGFTLPAKWSHSRLFSQVSNNITYFYSFHSALFHNLMKLFNPYQLPSLILSLFPSCTCSFSSFLPNSTFSMFILLCLAQKDIFLKL